VPVASRKSASPYFDSTARNTARFASTFSGTSSSTRSGHASGSSPEKAMPGCAAARVSARLERTRVSNPAAAKVPATPRPITP
jgi:hypothetical protein